MTMQQTMDDCRPFARPTTFYTPLPPRSFPMPESFAAYADRRVPLLLKALLNRHFPHHFERTQQQGSVDDIVVGTAFLDGCGLAWT